MAIIKKISKAPSFKEFRKKQEATAAAWFKKKGFAVNSKSDYILSDREKWGQNILEAEVYQFIVEQKAAAKTSGAPFPIHKYIHHGLSSQAMLFNLLGRLVLSKDYQTLSAIFSCEDLEINNSTQLKFEHFDRDVFKEKQQQPTSFDFAVINGGDKRSAYVEAKYLEAEFGKCSAFEGGNCDGQNPKALHEKCPMHLAGRNYFDVMDKYGLAAPFSESPICPLSIYYQFYRELMFSLEKNGYYFVLLDKRNPAFCKYFAGESRGLVPFLTGLLPEKIKPLVKVLYIQDVLSKIDPKVYPWVQEFAEKYGITG
jgi:hypothetical protein